MNKRGTIAIAMTTILLSSAIAMTTDQREFTTPKTVILPIEKETQQPLTVILPSKEIAPRATIEFGGDKYYFRKVNIVATHYTNSVHDTGKTDGITASGIRANRGTVAVPKSIPLGTEIILEDKSGNKQKVVALDRGSAIKWINGDTMKIDVFVPNATRTQLLNLGVKYYTGYILEEKVDD